MMNESIETISLSRLTVAFIPTLVLLTIYIKWSLNYRSALYALLRMFAQLLIIGYCLNYLFEQQHGLLTLFVIVFMLVISAWISLYPLKQKRSYHFSLAAISLSGIFILLFIINFVLNIKPWYQAEIIIPLAGMIFTAGMNSVSLAAERFESEAKLNSCFFTIRTQAMQASMIPTINSLFAVGLVSLPGMMTGQILSGVAPLIAARYQIMVMVMLFASSGLSAALYLYFMKLHYETQRNHKN